MLADARSRPLGPERVLRFTATERALHWGFALGYVALLSTGLLLMFPTLRGWIRGYTPVVGVRLHLAWGMLWALTTVAIVALGDRRRLRATARELARVDRDDWAWLRRFPRWLVARGRERAEIDGAVGRFNAGQKVNALFTVATSGVLLGTGLALWPVDAGGTALCALLTGSKSVGYWREAHRWLTFLVVGPLAGHVALAVLHPSTRPSLSGILGGRVDQAWAATHHPRWRVEERGREGIATMTTRGRR